MPVYPLFGVGQLGKSRTVTSQQHVNLYAEIQAEKEKATVTYYGTPGLTLFSDDLGDTPIRGWISVGTVFYAVHRGTFYEINNAGTITSRGTLVTTTGRVDMTYNGLVVLMVDGTSGYTYTVASTTFVEIADGDFPDGVTTCTWLDGQFIVGGDGTDTFFISPDGTAWDPLDFATAESNPDGLVRVFANNGEVLLFGDNTLEPWGNNGQGDFPFSPIKGGISTFGLAARWSMCEFNSGIAALMIPTGGQVQVMFISGYTPRPISTPEMDSIINGYATVSDAVAFSYMLGGHPMYQINFPSAMTSWLFDALSGMWSKLEYGLDAARHRAELHIDFINRPLVSDYSNGSIYELDPDTYTDNGTAIAREIVGRHVFKGNERFVIDELYCDFQTGVGLISGQGDDPQAMLTFSKDNGATWSAELWVTMGAIGAYLTRVVWRRLGVARDFLFKIRITDPIKVALTYAALRGRN